MFNKSITVILFAASLVMMGFAGKGQNPSYDPMVVENAHWVVGLWSYENPWWPPCQFFQYVLSGDSIINGNHYKKLYYRDLDDIHPEHILSEELFGLMREDTLSRKVYAITFNDNGFDCPVNEEFQLYDFDLDIGDATTLCFVWSGYSWIIYDIVYETLFGKERKIFYANTIDNDYLIEGVGSNSGLMEWGYFVKGAEISGKGAFYILWNYCIGTDEECGYQWVGLEKTQNPYGFRIFPNPLFEKRLFIRIGQPINELAKIVIFDALGAEVLNIQYKNIITDLVIELPAGLVNPHSILYISILVNNQPVFRQALMN